MVHMFRASFKESIPLRNWEIDAKYLLIRLQLSIVVGSSRAFSERTFSLSRCIKSWLRDGIDNKTFNDMRLHRVQ